MAGLGPRHILVTVATFVSGLLKKKKKHTQTLNTGFPGGSAVKNPPANAGDMGLFPGPGRSHMMWSN